MSKLTDQIEAARIKRLRQIQLMRKAGYRVAEIAPKMGLTRARIYQILKGTR